MSHTAKFRFIRTSWGIAIDITGRMVFEPADASVYNKPIQLLTPNLGLSEQEIASLDAGVSLMHTAIQSKAPQNCNCCIQLSAVEFNPCDYQIEGLKWAMAQWLAEVLGVPAPACSATYNRVANKYDFSA